MRRHFFVVIIFASQLLSAQEAALFLEDLTGREFRLALDGYAQNTEYVDQLLIENCKASGHAIFIKMKDTALTLDREIKFQGGGEHHYVITQNARGQVKLRYRGMDPQLPSGIIRLKRQKVLEWPDNPEQIKIEPPRPEKPAEVTKAPTRPEKQDTMIKKVEVVERSKTQNDPAAAPKVEVARDDSNSGKTAPKAPKAKVVKGDSVSGKSASKAFEEPNGKGTAEKEIPRQDSILTKVAKFQYEFEKLEFIKENYHPSGEGKTSLLPQLLLQLNYDQSRLELIEQYREHIRRKGIEEKIYNALQYEVSKATAEKLIDE